MTKDTRVPKYASTVAECAKFLNVHRVSLHKWMKMPGFPPRDSKNRFDVAAVAKWKGISLKDLDLPNWTITKAEVIALSENTNKTMKEISDIVGVSDATVNRIRSQYRKSRELVNFVKQNKADLVLMEQGWNHNIRTKIADELDKKSVEDLGVKELSDLFVKLGNDNSQLLKDERLVRGESTENIGMVVKFINELKEKQVE